MSVPALQPISPFVLKDVEFSVPEHDYAKHVSAVTFTPSSSQITWNGLNPAATFSDASATTWTCELAYAQDWKTAGSLSRYLLANAGKKVAVRFKPQAGSGLPVFKATVSLQPGPIGGEVNGVAVGTVTLGVDGAPTPDYDDSPATPNPATE